jgi:hypothetical protein
MIMKKVILVSVFCFVAFINGYSQTKKESIKELFNLMQTDSLIDKMSASIAPSMLNQMPGQLTDSVKRARSAELMISIMPSVKELIKKILDENMVDIYDKYFTQNEINDYISFYKTPSGQKLIQVSPDIQKDLMEVMSQRYMPELQKNLKVKFDELMKNEKK